MAQLLNAARQTRDELNISHETIDTIAGFPAGYTSKVLAPEPIRGLGYQSLGDLLGALGIALVVVRDPEQIAKVKGRWIPRKRPQKLPLLASAISINSEAASTLEITAELENEMRKKRMQELGRLGGLKAAGKGGKRRMKTMGKRARQRAATHAARMRWAKRNEIAGETPNQAGGA